jgi:hypothetical protein
LRPGHLPLLSLGHRARVPAAHSGRWAVTGVRRRSVSIGVEIVSTDSNCGTAGLPREGPGCDCGSVLL